MSQYVTPNFFLLPLHKVDVGEHALGLIPLRELGCCIHQVNNVMGQIRRIGRHTGSHCVTVYSSKRDQLKDKSVSHTISIIRNRRKLKCRTLPSQVPI